MTHHRNFGFEAPPEPVLRPSLLGTLLAAALLVGAAIVLATVAASHA